MSFSNELMAYAILIGFATYVIISADPGSSPFSWHPTFMVLAWVLLTVGVIFFRKPRPGWTRIGLHWALQASGLTLAIFGFLAIYRNKESSGKPHFVSWHGLIGIITITFLVLTAFGGNFANFSVAISRKVPSIQPKLVKRGHRLSGAVSLTGLTLTVFLALFSVWFQAVTNVTLWYMLATVVGYPLVYTLKTTFF
ncbi:cytochrome b561 domain-containing protein 1 [Folsomia candida]|uniref:cytochrome b561 domain-containing protein 1 n=1 Tax=Folsomia candida TaxID=158441 RepID=UPI000B8F612F|nr:cytochrome b561 domain-containing protein 1 [Folsomia candida]